MIVVAGESLIDVVVDADGHSSEEPGGSPLNVAVGLARLDVPSLLITQVGDDERGGAVVRHLHASGAEVLAVPSSDGRTATATATLDASGAASYRFDLRWDLPPQQLPACDALHVGSLGCVLEPGAAQVLDLVDQGYAREVFVSYDPNLRTEFVDDRAQAWRDVEALAARCNLVKLSDEDARLMHPGADPGDIARALLDGDRTDLVLLTRGGEGATAYADGVSVSHRPPPVDVVDTVGAGDAFMAATLAILFDGDGFSSNGPGLPLDEDGLRRLLRGAGAVASATCARRGANPPTLAELPSSWPD